MKWVRHEPGHYRSPCCRAKLSRRGGQWWACFHPDIAPNGKTLHPVDTLKQAKAIAEGAIEHAENRTGLRDELHQRLADGERYRAALESIRARCEESGTVDSDGLRRLVDEALRPPQKQNPPGGDPGGLHDQSKDR